MSRLRLYSFVLLASLAGCASVGERQLDTRVYDIRALLVDAPSFAGEPEFDLGAAMTSTSSGRVAINPADALLMKIRDERLEEFVNDIECTVGDQADWARHGGDSSVRELNGNLIVRTTARNHRTIERYLRAQGLKEGGVTLDERAPLIGDVP